MGKRRTIARELKDVQDDLKAIQTATTYGPSCLRWDNCADSSDRARIRMDIIGEAQEEFIDRNKKHILGLAAEKLESELKELQLCLEQH